MGEPQLDLFGESSTVADSGVTPAPVSADTVALARALPQSIHLGTSSWSFPGWRGLVYADKHSAATLAARGLHAYARHPLLRAVGLDRTYYSPIDSHTFAAYAACVPDDFRF